MKTIKTTTTSKTTSSSIDLFSDLDYSVPKKLKQEIAEEVGEYLREQIVLSVNELSSPISGGKFKSKLSNEYAEQKRKMGGKPVANLQMTGEMIDQLDYKTTSSGIEIGVFGDSALKADGHNNLSGESTLPERRFLPDVGQSFKSKINSEIEKIIKDKLVDDVSVSRVDFATIKNKAELYERLSSLYPEFEESDFADLVLRNTRLTTLLDEFNLLRFLDV